MKHCLTCLIFTFSLLSEFSPNIESKNSHSNPVSQLWEVKNLPHSVPVSNEMDEVEAYSGDRITSILFGSEA